MPILPPHLPSRSFRRPAAPLVLTSGVLAMVMVMTILASTSSTSALAASGDGAAGASQDPTGATDVAIAPRVGSTVPGIDVSHWQGSIDWARVAGAGKRFAFLKATDGQNYVDPRFFTNRAGAHDNGLMVGAYHFARPDHSTGDAVKEARHFVNVAAPKAGHLLPVLDIETTGGLDQDEMVTWARRFVFEVEELTGVTPLVYTSPYGWYTRFGDSRRIARDGAPLWVAHWGVSSPSLPAGDWDGQGWVVWQRSSTGSVAGISGNVDLDVLAGTSLGRIAIRRLTLEVEGGAGTLTSSPAGFGCRTTCTRNVESGTSITLTANPDVDAFFKGWAGQCSGTATTCAVTVGTNRSVSAEFVTDVTAPGVTIDVPSGANEPAVVRFDEAVHGVDASNVAMRTGQGPVAAARVCRNAQGDVRDCDASVIRSVRLIPREPLVPGRDYEIAVNPAGVTPRVKDRVGNVAPSSTTPFESSRGVDQSSGVVERWPERAWNKVTSPASSGGSYITAERAGASVRLAFDGTGIAWRTVTGPNQGRARIYLDGDLLRTVDLYAPTRTVGAVKTVGGLADRAHRLRIEVTGTARPASAGRWVSIDRFDVA